MLVPDPGFGDDDRSGGRIDLREVELPAYEPKPMDVAKHVRQGIAMLTTTATSIREFSAAHRPRPGAPVVETRRGESVEIMRTCPIRPHTTGRLVESGQLLAQPVRGLAIDQSTLRNNRLDYVWQARLRTGLLRRRRARLQITSTPSTNLTILALIPSRPTILGSRRFVARGVRSVGELAGRIEHLATPDLGPSR